MSLASSAVVSLNNQGANEILSKEFKQAIGTLSASLRAANGALARSPVPGEAAAWAAQMARPVFCIDAWMPEASLEEEVSSFFYDRPIRIPVSQFMDRLLVLREEYAQARGSTTTTRRNQEEEEELLTNHDAEIESFLQLSVLATTFNLGIALRGLAITKSETSTTTSSCSLPSQPVSHDLGQFDKTSILKKSLKLFKYSNELCEQTNQVRGFTLFVLANHNNIAHLYACLGQPYEARKGFKALLSTLMFLVSRKAVPINNNNNNDANDDGNAAPPSTSSLASHSYEAFFQNTSHLNYPNCSVGAGSA